MADPFISEIRIFPFNFAPQGWAFCDGQQLPKAQHTALFTLIGNTYGEASSPTLVKLPDLQGRTPMHPGQGPGLTLNHTLGEAGGEEAVMLQTTEIPQHSHSIMYSQNLGTTNNPGGAQYAAPRNGSLYADAVDLTPLAPEAMASAGGGQPHNNMQPYLTLYFNIALVGIMPSPG